MILNKIEQNIRVKIHVANKADVRPRSVGLKKATNNHDKDLKIDSKVSKNAKYLNFNKKLNLLFQN